MKDASFENKAALFTLAVSDLMMVNMYVTSILCAFYLKIVKTTVNHSTSFCFNSNETDINRSDGGGTRLFTSIFQVLIY